MGSVLIESKCGQTIVIEKYKKNIAKLNKIELQNSIILKNGEKEELNFYDYKKPNYCKIMTED